VLVAEFHSNGEPFIRTAQAHTEFVDAFYRIGQDRANKIVTLTGAGGQFISDVDWSSFGDVADPGVWSQIHDEGLQVLDNIANIRVPVIAASRRKVIMKQTLTIPDTFLGVGYTKDRAGLPLEAVRVPVPRPGTDQVLIRVAASSLNPLEYKLADLNFFGRTPPVILGLDLSCWAEGARRDSSGIRPYLRGTGGTGADPCLHRYVLGSGNWHTCLIPLVFCLARPERGKAVAAHFRAHAAYFA
jgi:hypothetical protein